MKLFIIDYSRFTGKLNFCKKRIDLLIKKYLGRERLEEIKKIKEFDNFTIFAQDEKYTPYEENENKRIYSVLDFKSYYDWDSISVGEKSIKIYLNPSIYFYCDMEICYMGEDI